MVHSQMLIPYWSVIGFATTQIAHHLMQQQQQHLPHHLILSRGAWHQCTNADLTRFAYEFASWHPHRQTCTTTTKTITATIKPHKRTITHARGGSQQATLHVSNGQTDGHPTLMHNCCTAAGVAGSSACVYVCLLRCLSTRVLWLPQRAAAVAMAATLPFILWRPSAVKWNLCLLHEHATRNTCCCSCWFHDSVALEVRLLGLMLASSASATPPRHHTSAAPLELYATIGNTNRGHSGVGVIHF